MKTSVRIRKAIFFRLAGMIGAKNMPLSYKLRYFGHRGRIPNLSHPRDLSEHLLGAMLNPTFQKYADFADKVKVRDYVKKKGLENILLNLYGVWKHPEDIKIDKLPEKFVIKTNNGSGNHVFCTKKDEFNLNNAILILQNNLNLVKTEKFMKEPHYPLIEPKVYCEELIETESGDWPVDYKFHCFHGQPIDIFVCTERKNNQKYCTYDLEWNKLNTTSNDYITKLNLQRPEQLNEMIEIAKKLSEDFPFVRVDLYNINERVIFGELTFSPWGGYMNSYIDNAIVEMGRYFKQPLSQLI